ncbi:MAG: KTSC domain-containing protein [Sulfitobacter sp.]
MQASFLELSGQLQSLMGTVCAHMSPKLSEPEIDRHFVRSTSIATLGYDAGKRCLQVEYYNGHLYRIDNVSAGTYQMLQSTEEFDQVFQQQVCAGCSFKRIGCLLPIYG